jgi:tetratricopeptide (TPR) repeat protein
MKLHTVRYWNYFAWAALLLITPCAVNADILVQARGELEGRVLENSAEVVVFETIHGEYLVLKHSQIVEIRNEPPEEFYYRRALMHEAKGADNRALLDLMETINRNPNHVRAQQRHDAIVQRHREERWNQGLQTAQQYEQQEEYRQALASYRRVLEMQPDDHVAQQIVQRMSDTHARIAFLFFNHCYDNEAIVELTKAEELNPNSAEIYYVLARIHHHSRNWEQARLEYERALELDPNHNSARMNLSRLIEETTRLSAEA